MLIAGLVLMMPAAPVAQAAAAAPAGLERPATVAEVAAAPFVVGAPEAPTSTPPPAAPTAPRIRRRILPSVLDTDFKQGAWSFHGYINLDAANYDQRPAGPPELDFRRGPVGASEPDRARQLTDGLMPRRARLGGEGSIGDVLGYRVMLELASHGSNGKKGPSLAEVWVSYTRFAPYSITVGAFPEPSNMEDATSSDSLLFPERATAADLARALGAGEGRLGVTLKRTDARWFAALSFTGPTLGHYEEFVSKGAIVARVSRTLRSTPDRSVHLGASATYVLGASGKRPADAPIGIPLRFRSTPEVDVDATTLIDTGDLEAAHANVLGLEFAAQRGALFLQSEAFRIGLDRGAKIRLPDARFYGYYVEGSWILTGERRRYDPSRAAFAFPKPSRPLWKGGWGAWEIAFRYSRMNLNDDAGQAGLPPPPGGARGGDQAIFALGLNWYPRGHVRFMLDYMRVSVDRLNPASARNPEPFGPPPATPPIGVQIGQTMNVVALRARYSF